MAKCEEAREYITQWLKDEGLDGYVDQEQIEELVAACCDDLGSQACVNAMATVAATGACVAYTEGVCVPCCSVAGRLLGPIVGNSLGAAWEMLKDVWNAVSSFFGGGSCDYDPAADKLIAAYANAAREIADGLDEAWNTSRLELHLPEGPPVFVEGVGGFWRPYPTKPDWADDQAVRGNSWRHALVHNAATWSKRYGPPQFKWTIDGKDGYLFSPPVDPDANLSFEQFFDFTWKDYPCNEADNWKNAAEHVSEIRMGFVEGASAWMLQKAVIEISKESEAQRMDRVHELSQVFSKVLSPPVQVIKLEDKGMSGTTIAAIVLALAGAGYAGYHYRDKLFGVTK